MITRYLCGHTGKMTTGKVKAFIRVTEIRQQKTEGSDRQCPDCRRSDD